jgi:hypothetical protein
MKIAWPPLPGRSSRRQDATSRAPARKAVSSCRHD